MIQASYVLRFLFFFSFPFYFPFVRVITHVSVGLGVT